LKLSEQKEIADFSEERSLVNFTSASLHSPCNWGKIISSAADSGKSVI